MDKCLSTVADFIQVNMLLFVRRLVIGHLAHLFEPITCAGLPTVLCILHGCLVRVLEGSLVDRRLLASILRLGNVEGLVGSCCPQSEVSKALVQRSGCYG